MSATAPPYPAGKSILEGKTVVVTAAAGTGIGFAAAKRCIEEGAAVLISDLHERRLGQARRVDPFGQRSDRTAIRADDGEGQHVVVGHCGVQVGLMGVVDDGFEV